MKPAQKDFLFLLSYEFIGIIILLCVLRAIGVWKRSVRPYATMASMVCAVIVVSVALVTCVNIFVLPWGPINTLWLSPLPSMFIIISIGTLAVAYVSYRSWPAKSSTINIASILFSSILAFLAMSYFSLFILLNTKGS